MTIDFITDALFINIITLFVFLRFHYRLCTYEIESSLKRLSSLLERRHAIITYHIKQVTTSVQTDQQTKIN